MSAKVALVKPEESMTKEAPMEAPAPSAKCEVG